MNERENIGMLKKWFFKLYIPDRRTFQECKPDIASFLEKLLFDTQKDNVPAYYEILSDHEDEDVRKLAADILEINSTRIEGEK
nr:hypothetical protein [Candidatus Sigynarchaeota archaeon]